MAEVHLLPVSIDEAGARRLADALTTMIDGGGDFGPREAQIQSIGQSLAIHVQRLRAELTRLGLAERLAEPLGSLERMASLALSYQADASS